VSDGRRTRAQATRTAILAAARDLLVQGAAVPAVGAVAVRAGVSRLTVYQHFGSRDGLLDALAAAAREAGEPAGGSLEATIRAACERWAADPGLYRNLPLAAGAAPEMARQVAARLAAEDLLRPGCSVREAEDVIAIATSFAAFDRLHQDGRRSVAAVADILHRMAASVLDGPAYD
jgi:AcrR family transcriptional regulator